ncbi:MAG: hypothetical protein HEEMFOPI_00723 [Holosporales bacterium]
MLFYLCFTCCCDASDVEGSSLHNIMATYPPTERRRDSQTDHPRNPLISPSDQIQRHSSTNETREDSQTHPATNPLIPPSERARAPSNANVTHFNIRTKTISSPRSAEQPREPQESNDLTSPCAQGSGDYFSSLVREYPQNSVTNRESTETGAASPSTRTEVSSSRNSMSTPNSKSKSKKEKEIDAWIDEMKISRRYPFRSYIPPQKKEFLIEFRYLMDFIHSDPEKNEILLSFIKKHPIFFYTIIDHDNFSSCFGKRTFDEKIVVIENMINYFGFQIQDHLPIIKKYFMQNLIPILSKTKHIDKIVLEIVKYKPFLFQFEQKFDILTFLKDVSLEELDQKIKEYIEMRKKDCGLSEIPF